MKHPKYRIKSTCVSAAAGLGVVALLAACGSSSGKSSAAAAGAPTSAAAGTGAASGGRAGQTINVELVTGNKGAVQIPQFGDGAIVMANWVNAHGGINGAKLKLDVCGTDSTPEGSISCANAAIDHRDATDFSAGDYASDASVPKLAQAGVPLIMDFPSGVASSTNPDVFQLTPSSPAALAGPLSYFVQNNGVKKPAFVGPDVPSTHQTVPPVAGPTGKKLGLKITPYYLSQNDPNTYNTTVLAMKSAGIDYAYLGLPESQCTSMVTAAHNLGYKGILVTACSQYIAADPTAAAGTYVTTLVYPYVAASAAPPAIRSDLQTYAQRMKAGGQASLVADNDALDGYSAMGDFIKVLQGIPTTTAITATSIKAALRAANFTGLFGEKINCTGANAVKTDVTACSSSIALVKVGQGQSLTPVGGGVIDVGPFLRSYLAP